MSEAVNAADIEAMIDVVEQVTEESDSTPFERAADLREVLLALSAKARDAAKLLETQMMTYLEDAPRRYGDRTFEVVNDGVYRADHDEILSIARHRAFREAVNTETGEVDTKRALEIYQVLVASLYLSPSTSVKVGGLKMIGLTDKASQRDVRRYEPRGRKLAIVEHDAANAGGDS